MNLAGSGLQSGNLPWLLGLSTEAWGSEFRGGGMGEEEGEERERCGGVQESWVLVPILLLSL